MSDMHDNRYSEDEVSRLIKRALKGANHSDTISHEELLDIAEKSGVSPEEMRRVLDEEESSYELDEAKVRWIKRHRADFHNHLRTYVIVNGSLIMLNLVTTGFRGYFWALWPIMAWGIGLLFHASDTYFVSDEKIEKGARKLLRKRRHVERANKWMSSVGDEIKSELKKNKWYCDRDEQRDRY